MKKMNRQTRAAIAVHEKLAALRAGPDDDIADAIDKELARLRAAVKGR